MDLEVVGAVQQVDLKGGEAHQDAQQEHEHDEGHRVQTCTHSKAQQHTRPQTHRGSKSLDLSPGAEQDGVARQHGGGNDGGSRQQRQPRGMPRHQKLIQQHGGGGRKGDEHEGAQTCRMPFTGALAANDGCKKHDHEHPQQHRIGIEGHRPLSQQGGKGVGQWKISCNVHALLLLRKEAARGPAVLM